MIINTIWHPTVTLTFIMPVVVVTESTFGKPGCIYGRMYIRYEVTKSSNAVPFKSYSSCCKCSGNRYHIGTGIYDHKYIYKIYVSVIGKFSHRCLVSLRNNMRMLCLGCVVLSKYFSVICESVYQWYYNTIIIIIS